MVSMIGSQLAKVEKNKLKACMTCPLCNDLFTHATTITECLHTFCKKCIYDKITEEDLETCPVCNTGLGCAPLEKLRADNNLQELRVYLFASKAKKRKAATTALPSSRHRKKRSLSLLALSSPTVTQHLGATTRESEPCSSPTVTQDLGATTRESDPNHGTNNETVPPHSNALLVEESYKTIEAEDRPKILNPLEALVAQNSLSISVASTSELSMLKKIIDGNVEQCPGLSNFWKSLNLTGEAATETIPGQRQRPNSMISSGPDNVHGTEERIKGACMGTGASVKAFDEPKENGEAAPETNPVQRERPNSMISSGLDGVHGSEERIEGACAGTVKTSDEPKEDGEAATKTTPGQHERPNSIISSGPDSVHGTEERIEGACTWTGNGVKAFDEPKENGEAATKTTPGQHERPNSIISSGPDSVHGTEERIKGACTWTGNGVKAFDEPKENGQAATETTRGQRERPNSIISSGPDSVHGTEDHIEGVRTGTDNGVKDFNEPNENCNGNVSCPPSSKPFRRRKLQSVRPKRAAAPELSWNAGVEAISGLNGKFREVWFRLIALENQKTESPLPQIATRYLRVKDYGRLTVSKIKTYLVEKLSLASEDEVEISFMGQPVVSTLLVSSLLDWWVQSASAFEHIRTSIGSSAKDVVIIFTYSRKIQL